MYAGAGRNARLRVPPRGRDGTDEFGDGSLQATESGESRRCSDEGADQHLVHVYPFRFHARGIRGLGRRRFVGRGDVHLRDRARPCEFLGRHDLRNVCRFHRGEREHLPLPDRPVSLRALAGRPSRILTPTARRYTFHDVPDVPTGGFFGRVTFKNTVRRRCGNTHQ